MPLGSHDAFWGRVRRGEQGDDSRMNGVEGKGAVVVRGQMYKNRSLFFFCLE